MDSTDTLRGGIRHELTVELGAVREIDSEGVTVQQWIGDGDETVTLFVPPDVEPQLDLRTGVTYRFEGIWGCTRVTSVAGGADAARHESEECPSCGGALRGGEPIDAFPSVRRAVDRLELEGLIGVVDAETRAVAVDNEGMGVDDWQPMRETNRPPAVPDFVCRDCGDAVATYELRGDHPVEESVVESAPMLDNQVVESSAPAADASEQTLGLAAGGAKDVDNFRENVREGYTPQPDAITEEGLFYDYHFETRGESPETDSLFAPQYAGGVSDHPITGETERYLAVGLDSTLSMAEFERPRLDLVAVLDVSGSMNSQFDQYYYDEHGRKRTVDEDERSVETKLEAATQSLCALTEQLRDEDRLGVVLFNNRSHVAKPLRDVGETDMDAIRGHIYEVSAGGGTNMADGFQAAAELLANGTQSPDVERRVVFMTDAMPNTGTTGTEDLTALFGDAAADGIHTTFIGMGIDANAELVDALSGIRGANHYFVHSASEFERRLGDEFDYMVTPLVYDLGLELETDNYEIADVHGSPSADAATGRLMHVGTLFPSPKQEGETRGGIVLVRVERTDSGVADLELVASWTERGGSEHTERVQVDLPESGYDHDGVRKGVALTRYARVLQSWASDVHDRADQTTGVDDWLLTDQHSDHERESVPLVVSDDHAERIATIRSYLDAEAAALNGDFSDEFELLNRLLQAAEYSDGPEVTRDA